MDFAEPKRKRLELLQAKVYPEVIEKWETIYSNGDFETRGQAMEFIIESFLNPKTKVVPDPADKQKIDEQAAEIVNLKTLLENLKNEQLPEGVIVLKMEPEKRKELWAVLKVAEKAGWARTYEELIERMFQALRKRGEMIFDANDIAYINSIEYDG